MNYIIFGKERPKIGFIQSKSGGVNFRVENILEFNPTYSMITWRDFICSSRFSSNKYNYKDELFWTLDEYSPDGWLEYLDDIPIPSMTDEAILISDWLEKFANDVIEDLIEVDAEKKFFQDYVALCRKCCRGNCWETPALIPQVWVNWLPYDTTDEERAKRARREPFRVDFVMKDNNLSENLVIIEVDGFSHFTDNKGSASLDVYTEHLCKDRWLRKQGWQVYRISNKEVKEYDDIGVFLANIFGCTYPPLNWALTGFRAD